MPNVCDWWIIDDVLLEWLQGSYPVLNLFGHCQDLVFVMSLLCMDCQKLIQFHIEKLIILYLEVFNHTRKITRNYTSRDLVLFYLPIQMQSCSFAVIPLKILRCVVIS